MKPTITTREVILPNGIRCLEVETLFHGNSETQMTYDYWVSGESDDDEDTLIDINDFKTDYWGRIEGLEFP